ncbi:MAG TPA: hypothetical protein DHN33_02455 [Eubacteriaceae bacterium]|nr:hypothetical protein [Eubacteriaceae bacterium]
MPRPRKWRRVCCLPENNVFGALDAEDKNREVIVMTVDEYETIRLIDLEGEMQQGCADRMNVARTTVQRIYNDARKKIADAMVNGKTIKIEGGDYLLCNKTNHPGRCKHCQR